MNEFHFKLNLQISWAGFLLLLLLLLLLAVVVYTSMRACARTHSR